MIQPHRTGGRLDPAKRQHSKHQSSWRLARLALAVLAAAGLAAGAAASLAGLPGLARVFWAAAVIPVAGVLAASIIRDVAAGRMGVDVIALLSMTGAAALDEFLAGAVVALMYAGGGVLEDRAVARAEAELRSLTDRAPRIAHRRRGADIEDIPVEDAAIGDVILTQAGEIIPVDGVIASEAALLDESTITGEPIPVRRLRGELARSGTVNAGDAFELTATAPAGESAYAGIVRMVTAARTAKAPFMRLADRFALYLFPLTVAVAGASWLAADDPVRGLAVLVAATPCPLIIAAPVAFIAGVSQAARRGVLIKGGAALEALARIRTVLLDKTGTLTVGGARLAAIETAPGESADETLRLAASLEQASQHVIAGAIKAAALARGLKLEAPEQVRETVGSGVEGLVAGRRVRVGSNSLVFGAHAGEPWAQRAQRRAAWRSALAAFVAVDDRPVGALLLADEIRRDTPRAILALRAAEVERIVMVTGDHADSAESIGAALDLNETLSERTPAEKVEAVLSERRVSRTLMVGDGVNDAPALAAADVGAAMGARGATASSEAADVVILVDRLDRVGEAIAIARRARTIALQSVWAGMGLSGAAMIAAAWGWLTPVAGALTQEVIDVAVILNALRALSPGRSVPALAGAGAGASLLEERHGLEEKHALVERSLDRLREIADALDDAAAAQAVRLISEARRAVSEVVARHEREDETRLYPILSGRRAPIQGLSALSRAHREILHQARLLERLAEGLRPEDADAYLVRDARRVIESIVTLMRLHIAQEEDFYAFVAPR